MILPTIHLNGTHVDDLIEQAEQAEVALNAAIVKFRAMAPNGRDYYPQGPDVINRAVADYSVNLARLNAILTETRELLEHLYSEQEARIRR